MFSKITPAWNRLFAVSAVVTLAAGLSGCATRYAMKVDAIQNPNVKGGQSYRLVSKDPSLPSRDEKNYADAEKAVRVALSSKGLYPAPDPQSADLEVEIDFDVGAQRTKLRSADQPTIFGAATMIPSGGSALPGSLGPVGRGPSSPVQQMSQQSVEPAPQTFIVHHVFEKRLTISARETPGQAGSDHHPAEVWRVEVTLEDEKNSFDGLIPVMAAAASDKIGTDTRTRQSVKISEKDAVVAFVKQGM